VKRLFCAAVVLLSLGLRLWGQPTGPQADRLVILKVDGLNADLLFRTMAERNPETGQSRLPWINKIFAENGLIFDNFYTRGISLSAPSWSMLDTGHHLLIKGNVEYDRYTGRVYDYLNFFPFYLGYARERQQDMPSVQVLDEAGIPLTIDAFAYDQRYQSFQLFQRGVRWTTLQRALRRRVSKRAILSLLEDPQDGLGLGSGLAKQMETELEINLQNPKILYLDLFTGDIDHTAHSINDPLVLRNELTMLDAAAGRIWTSIQGTGEASRTLFAVVSDHGMNNVPNIYSQTFSIPNLLNSPEGGAHHVLTNRHQLDNYKIAGLDPLVSRVVNPSTSSFYLQRQADRYPTAWLDLDGNERAAVSLRNSDLNRIQILLQQLSRTDLNEAVRAAAAGYLNGIIDRHREQWSQTIEQLEAELAALGRAITQREKLVKQQPKRWSREQQDLGLDKAARRQAAELKRWEEERERYRDYVRHLKALLVLEVGGKAPLHVKIEDLIAANSLGDANTAFDIQHYVAGPAAGGLAVNAQGDLDERASFRHVDYLSLFSQQVIRNNPQHGVSPRPIDFLAMTLPAEQAAAGEPADGEKVSQGIWLYADEEHQIVELIARDEGRMRIRLIPCAQLQAGENGQLNWQAKNWGADFPMHLYEDGNLNIPPQANRAEWLSQWHTEREWFQAIHQCHYSDGVIGITEELLPPSVALPKADDKSPLRQLELRRRQLVQPDFHVFAADHWNFNVRNFNPGGNHGSFLRISTHSVWMMAGAGITQGHVEEPYDSLNFASTLLHLVGRPVPMPDRVVQVGKENAGTVH
jgi:hypothetical protein